MTDVSTTVDPVISVELQRAARRLLQSPLLCAEIDPDSYSLVRRHEAQLGQWFTQRLGYRLHLTATTARLYKSTGLPFRRPLRTATSTKRPLSQREYTYLALVLAAVAAGPRIISLHDLIQDVRSAAAEAGVTLFENGADRRALITAVRWMIEHGLATELHEQVERYIADADADAIIEFDPDRIALVALPSLSTAASAADVVDRSERRAANPRQWMRARLAEDPVLYRSDLTDTEWTELRSRRSDEERFLDEMFDLALESRAEGLAAIDPSSAMSDRPFPVTRTVGHAALLLVAALAKESGPVPLARVEKLVAKTATEHRKRWAKDSVDRPDALAADALDLLVDQRLVTLTSDTATGRSEVLMLPAGGRFAVDERLVDDDDDAPAKRTARRRRSGGSSSKPAGAGEQGQMW